MRRDPDLGSVNRGTGILFRETLNTWTLIVDCKILRVADNRWHHGGFIVRIATSH